jgi:flagellum-specific peptidoglycan hydrolase FlgJ
VISGLLIALLILFLRARRANYKDGAPNIQVIRQSKYKALERFILAQARHESNNFTSPVYKANNNPFGFKKAEKRKQAGKLGTPAPKKEGGNYWHYPSDTEAFKDLIVYFEAVNFPTSVRNSYEYASALKARKYFTDSVDNYKKGIDRWL